MTNIIAWLWCFFHLGPWCISVFSWRCIQDQGKSKTEWCYWLRAEFRTHEDCIRIWVRQTWRPITQTPLQCTLLSDSRLDPQAWSLVSQPRSNIVLSWTTKIWWPIDATLAPLHFLCMLGLDPSVNSLRPKNTLDHNEDHLILIWSFGHGP